MPLPDIRGRVQILQHHMRGVTTSKGNDLYSSLSFNNSTLSIDVDPKVIARGTPGFSGADLQNMVK